MMRQILIEQEFGQTRLALLEDGHLAEYYVERPGENHLPGSIYLGRVKNILPGMQAAFVDIGLDRNAFLHAGDIKLDTSLMDDEMAQKLKNATIGQMVRGGQELLVQVIKDPGGSKGPRITGQITLPGRLCVLMPTMEFVGVSRQIEAEDRREALRRAALNLRPKSMGLIIRTAAQDATDEELAADIQAQLRLWERITALAKVSKSPALIHQSQDLASRAVRDMLTADVQEMLIEGGDFDAIMEQCAIYAPHLVDRVHQYGEQKPLFDALRVDEQLKKLTSRKVWLKSGGFLVIDYTEALTVIDVNSGKFTNGKSIDDTAYKINCEAAKEIARQLRLRDIGGIIVIDFIDMATDERRQSLLNELREALKNDRTRTNVVGITDLGLVEMTRKKTRLPMHQQIMQPCPLCDGAGYVLSAETVARQALHQALLLYRLGSRCMMIRAGGDVADALTRIGFLPDCAVYVITDAVWRDRFAVTDMHPHDIPPQAVRLTDYTQGS